MPELNEEQRARLAKEALEQADEILTEKEQEAAAFRSPNQALSPEPSNVVDIREKLAKPQATATTPESAHEAVDEATVKRLANVLIKPGGRIEDVVDYFKGDPNQMTEFLKGQIPGEETESKDKAA